MSSRKLTRDIIAVLGSNITTLLLGLCTGIILARVLGPDGRGAFAALLIIPGLFASIALLGTRQSAIYFVGKKLFDDEKIISSILITLIFSSVVGGGICLLYFILYPNISFAPILIILAIAGIPTRLLITYAGGFFLGKENYRMMSILKIFPAFLNLLFTALFLIVFELSIKGALLSMFVSNLIIDIYIFYKIQQVCPVRIRIYPEVQKKMFKMGLLYASSLLIMQLNYRVDILLLQYLSSFEQIGLYVLAVSISQQLWILPSSIGTVVKTRTVNETDPDEINMNVARLLRISLIVCFCGAIILYFLAFWLLPFIYGKDFVNSTSMLQAILPGTLMMVFFKVLNSHIAGMGKPWITIYIFFPVMLLNIAMNLWLIPHYGGIGAALASTVSYSAGGIALLIIYSAITKNSIQKILTFQSGDFRTMAEVAMVWKWVHWKKTNK